MALIKNKQVVEGDSWVHVPDDQPVPATGDVVVGLALIGLSLPRGTRSSEHYGGWDRAIV
jgi:uncharacterized protein (DUF934 family)